MVTDNILIASDTWYVLVNGQRRTSSLSMPVNSCCSNTNYDAFIVSIALSVQNDKWTLNAGIIFEQGTREKKLGRTSIDQKNEPSRWKKRAIFMYIVSWVPEISAHYSRANAWAIKRFISISSTYRFACTARSKFQSPALSLFFAPRISKPKEVNSFDFSGKTSRVCVLATVGRYYIFFPGC